MCWVTRPSEPPGTPPPSVRASRPRSRPASHLPARVCLGCAEAAHQLASSASLLTSFPGSSDSEEGQQGCSQPARTLMPPVGRRLCRPCAHPSPPASSPGRPPALTSPSVLCRLVRGPEGSQLGRGGPHRDSPPQWNLGGPVVLLCSPGGSRVGAGGTRPAASGPRDPRRWHLSHNGPGALWGRVLDWGCLSVSRAGRLTHGEQGGRVSGPRGAV